MLVLPGSPALAESKRGSLLRDIKLKCPIIRSVDAFWIHLVKCHTSEKQSELSFVDSSHRKALDHLLAYGDDISLVNSRTQLESRQNVVYVLPRPGSISPWSSKATDIATLCNLSGHIERLERGIVYVFTTENDTSITQANVDSFADLIHDRMTQVVQIEPPAEDALFSHHNPKPLRVVDLVGSSPTDKLTTANRDLGLALAADELTYLADAYISGPAPMNRNPTDAELFMFAQVNSEHCRHKIFNASWTIDDTPRDSSLFSMIRNTERSITGAHNNTISAYSDNAAVLQGHSVPRFGVAWNPATNSATYRSQTEGMPILIKVETHNHPTAVSPHPGAATGSGGEIRDEGAVGRGSKPKAGLSGFTTSNLLVPGYTRPWETDFGKPVHIASALDIMIEGPLGASAFNNEFGRPALAGYFRTFAERVLDSEGEAEIRGYHKPIMIAGGYGNVRPQFAHKGKITPGAKIVVLGGPGMLIGLGGGAASSQVSGASSAELDFASVQRDNAEMQRRCQMVIDACVSLEGAGNPIQSIHDVGAGGLSNALPELVHDSELGARFEIRDVLVADSSLSPMEIWCNESQERYVLALAPDKAGIFEVIAKRERCPFSIVGVATQEDELVVTDRLFGQDVIRLKMSTLFGKPPKMSRADISVSPKRIPFDTSLAKFLPDSSSPSERIALAVQRVLRLPSVGSKSFLITIGDRSITGLVTRDQMVGPWQVPVADVAVTRSSYGFNVISGEAMAMGERTPVALISPAASARLAVAESLTNLAAAAVGDIGKVKHSANWMCAASKKGEGAALYEAVKAVGMELCPALGVGIPVGKDSMSMSMKWKERGDVVREVSAPLSLIVTAFAAVQDVGTTWTPQLRADIDGPTILVLLDLANGKRRLGGSALAQVFKEIGDESPDVEDPAVLKAFFQACQRARVEVPDLVLAYHDVSDGGLLTTIAEMCFAGRVGVDVALDSVGTVDDPLPALFSEELGAVVQIRASDRHRLVEVFADVGFPSESIHNVGTVNVQDEAISVNCNSTCLFRTTRPELQLLWGETSYAIQSLRDDPLSAKQEYDLIADQSYKGVYYELTFTYSPTPVFSDRPKVAILREQGVNGQVEMAWAFTAAGFDATDVHMSDILSGKTTLRDFRGVAACGGFAYGDVLGAGKGWAHSVLLNAVARKEFVDFFNRVDSFTLAVCNGCQFLSHLRGIIPGAQDWPDFKPNKSQRFEARASVVEIVDSAATRSSVFLREMIGSKLPVAVAHGEGRVSFSRRDQQHALESQGLVGVRYVANEGQPTEVYPLNPNGSPGGITGVQTPDGRVLALMPHPERVTTLESNSWYPPPLRQEWGGVGPWFHMFQSVRVWCQ